MNVDKNNVFIISTPVTLSYLKCKALNVGFYNNRKKSQKE